MKIAVAGCTGLAGREILNLLAAEAVPAAEVIALGVGRSAKEPIPWRGGELLPLEIDTSLAGVDLVILALPPEPAREVGERALAAGARIIDLSGIYTSAPAIVPELNGSLISPDCRVVRNPNCISVILTLALAGLQRAVGIGAVVVTTFQAVSGAGKGALEQYRREVAGQRAFRVLPGPIAGNILPVIGETTDTPGVTTEEEDLVRQVPFILGAPDLCLEATCTRVPVAQGHCFSVTCRLEESLSLERAGELLAATPGVEFFAADDQALFPVKVTGEEAVRVGRLRYSAIMDPGLSFWVVGDQLRRGTALNVIALLRLLGS